MDDGSNGIAIPRMSLEMLAEGFSPISQACGQMMAEAGAVSLDQQGHPCGVRLFVEGSFSTCLEVHWTGDITEPMRRSWNDPDVATEHGAYGIAILLIRTLTGYTIIERSRKGTGFDWWLGNEDELFQAKARLEVSGIARGDNKAISSRISVKKTQTRQSDELKLPAFIVVVEFGTPKSKVVKR
jgi:hypothetical protein